MPTLVAFVLWIALATIGIEVGVGAFERWLTEPTATSAGPVWPVLREAAVIALDAAVIVAALGLAFVFAQPLSGPALDRVVHAQERALGGRDFADTPFWSAVGRAIAVTFVTLAVGAPILLGITVVEVFVPAVAVVTWPLKLGISALLATWNFVDYPFALRGVGVRARLAWYRANVGACFGFGLVAALVAFVPLVGLLVLPFGVAGAARLVALTEHRDAP